MAFKQEERGDSLNAEPQNNQGKKQLYQQENEHQVEGAKVNPNQTGDVSDTENDVLDGGAEANRDQQEAAGTEGRNRLPEGSLVARDNHIPDQVANWTPNRDIDRPTEEIRSSTQGVDGESNDPMRKSNPSVEGQEVVEHPFNDVAPEGEDPDRKGKNPDEWETKEEEEEIRTRIHGDIPGDKPPTSAEPGTDASDADKTGSGSDPTNPANPQGDIRPTTNPTS